MQARKLGCHYGTGKIRGGCRDADGRRCGASQTWGTKRTSQGGGSSLRVRVRGAWVRGIWLWVWL